MKTIEERHQQVKTRIEATKKTKIRTILSEALENREAAFPKNTVKDVVRFFNLMSASPIAMGKAYKVDLFFAGLIDERGEFTGFGQKLIFMNDQQKTELIKQKILQLPKMKALKDVFSQPAKVTIRELQEKIPSGFLGNYSASTKVHLITKLSSWLK